ncbi:Aconitase family protein [Pleurostoma richardsiae]|uniref:Aconitase family protein n=1 Tax=Pleurostoma richardsiae TaxID=41990 RepID=A0AA38RFA0_9PEZI|nr:Aconitase family protein [Pleurostoma richardsiae]
MTSINVREGSYGGLCGCITSSLKETRGIDVGQELTALFKKHPNAFEAIREAAWHLRSRNHSKEADTLVHVTNICKTPVNYGGLGLTDDGNLTEENITEIGFLISASLEALNSSDRSNQSPVPAAFKPPERRPMTLAEKIFAMHNVEPTGEVCVGDTIRVYVDWIMASEASWSGMERTYNQLGEPGIFRNDRFWLAGDHVVDPRAANHPAIRKLIESSERAKKVFKMTEYQGMNYTIMHTEFYRERAQPGMLVIGSDSHTCSSGAVGCLSIGLGAADVTMGLVIGEIWLKVPECVNIRLVGKPGNGIGGKDVILYILQQLKRNTVASDRVVEYTGPGLQYLSPDARFAIANMTTEFGGITGIFVPDAVTSTFINSRKVARHKNDSNYFRPDEDAVYAETYTIDLCKAHSFVAKYPNPDDVVPVDEVTGTELNGCFIGACTTAEEDIVLAALVLEQGLKNGMTPTKKGKRKVVPGSRPILDRLRKSGLAEMYEQAGFEVGVPGCSYCVGMSVDRAEPGEVWLSSQNRNFENRMGQGAIGNLASAATVAASSFDLKIRDPCDLIAQIDPARWESVKGRGSLQPHHGEEPRYVEPFSPQKPAVALDQDVGVEADATARGLGHPTQGMSSKMILGKVQRLGDFIDTDALAPAQFLVECGTNEELGAHCMEFTMPEFRDRVKNGFNIVVGGKAFGCGSSREQAVNALIGIGVKCVIAKSFAFIYSRNQPSLGLLGITITDEAFYEAARDGIEISIDLGKNVAEVGGCKFPFQLSGMEKELIELGGITPAFMKFGKQLFEELCSSGTATKHKRADETADCASSSEGFDW